MKEEGGHVLMKDECLPSWPGRGEKVVAFGVIIQGIN